MIRCRHFWRYRNTLRFWVSTATMSTQLRLAPLLDERVCGSCAERTQRLADLRAG